MGEWIDRSGKKNTAKVRLFTFPHSGGNAAAFRMWNRKLPEHIEVFPILMPGREKRMKEPIVTDRDLIVKEIADAVEQNGDLPFAFFGHSLGGLMLFEVVHALVDRGSKCLPKHLFVSACKAPQDKIADPSCPLSSRDDDGFIQGLQEILPGSIPDMILQNKEFLQLFIPPLKGDYKIYELYEMDLGYPQLDIPITALAGQSDHFLSPNKLEAWAQQTTANFDLHIFPGDHFYVYKDSQDAVLRLLTKLLDECI